MPRRPLAGLPEVATYFGLPEKTIRGQVHRKVGVGQLAFRVGRYLRWDWNDIDAFIESEKQRKQAA